MNRRQAGYMALAKRLSGWLIFIPSLISTLISLLKYINHRPAGESEINVFMMDFVHVIIDLLQSNTPFLRFFWQQSPQPDFHGQTNLVFWIIYVLIFIAMALQASGAAMKHQSDLLAAQIENQLIIARAKGEQAVSRQQLEANIVIRQHSVLRQYFTLYILPFIVIIVGYFALSLLGLI